MKSNKVKRITVAALLVIIALIAISLYSCSKEPLSGVVPKHQIPTVEVKEKVWQEEEKLTMELLGERFIHSNIEDGYEDLGIKLTDEYGNECQSEEVRIILSYISSDARFTEVIMEKVGVMKAEFEIKTAGTYRIMYFYKTQVLVRQLHIGEEEQVEEPKTTNNKPIKNETKNQETQNQTPVVVAPPAPSTPQEGNSGGGGGGGHKNPTPGDNEDEKLPDDDDKKTPDDSKEENPKDDAGDDILPGDDDKGSPGNSSEEGGSNGGDTGGSTGGDSGSDSDMPGDSGHGSPNDSSEEGA